eukprot:8898778-Karenia_brevis.AAC.1
MKVVSRRKSRFERNKNQSKVTLKANFESRSPCHCSNEGCDKVRWIQPVEKDDPQRMVLDFQAAEVSKPLLAVKRIVEK